MKSSSVQRLVAALCFFVTLRSAAQPAEAPSGAEPPETPGTARARLLFEQGRLLLDDGHPEEACTAFEASDALASNIATLLNLGLCHRASGRLATALDYFEKAEALASQKGDEERKAAAAKDIAQLRPLVATLSIVVLDTSDPDLEVIVDGKARPRTTWFVGLPVDSGRHDVVARSSHREPFRATLLVVDGVAHSVVVPPWQPPRAKRPPTAHPPTGEAGPAQKIAAITSGALGVTSFGLAAGFAAAARVAYDDSSPHCTVFDVCDAKGVSLRHDAAADATRANIALAIGVVAAASGITLWFTLPRHPHPSTATRVGVGAHGVAFEGQF